MGSAPGPRQSLGSALTASSGGRGMVIGAVIVVLVVIAAIIGFVVR
jgi:hypothetical protein